MLGVWPFDVGSDSSLFIVDGVEGANEAADCFPHRVLMESALALTDRRSDAAMGSPSVVATLSFLFAMLTLPAIGWTSPLLVIGLDEVVVDEFNVAADVDFFSVTRDNTRR